MSPSVPQIILLTSAIVSLPMMLVLFIIARTYSSTIKGLKDCGLAILIMLLAVPLLIGRGIINDFYSIVIANLLIIAGFLQLLNATQKIANVRTLPKRVFWAILCASLILISWFTYLHESITIRVLTFSTITGGILGVALYVAQKFIAPSSGKYVLVTSIVLTLLARVLRVGSILAGLDQPVGLFDYSLSQIVILGIPALAVPLSTVGFIMIAADRVKSLIERDNQFDALTNTLTRKVGLKELNKEASRSKRQATKLVTMFIDLDDFKAINDQHGHLGGDRVLVDLAEKTKGCLRETDQLLRYGGDEFLAVLPATDIEQAKLVAKRIHQKAAENSPIPWSVSIGLAEFKGKEETVEALLERADQALYKAKLKGKNKTMIA